MIANKVNSIVLTMYDIDHYRWHTGIMQQLNQRHACCRIALTGLNYICIAAYRCHGKHPQWDHGREIERSDASAYTDWRPVRSQVHIFGNPWQSFAQKKIRQRTALF